MNGKWTRANFEKHHAANQHIYKAFVRFALYAARRRDHYSAKMVMYRVRWDTDVEENHPNREFKVDDGWISHYARMFMEDYPEHDGFFETRVRRDSYHELGAPPTEVTIQTELI